MTQPPYTQKPFVPQVHQERTTSQTTGMDQNTASTLRGKLIESILQLVVQAITGVFDPTGGLGSAFSQLTHWAVSLLPAQILAPLQSLVGLLVTVLDSIPIIGPPLGNAVTDLANLFGLMNSNTNDAQSSGDTANIGVAALNAQLAAITAPPGGVSVTDNFDRVGSDMG